MNKVSVSDSESVPLAAKLSQYSEFATELPSKYSPVRKIQWCNPIDATVALYFFYVHEAKLWCMNSSNLHELMQLAWIDATCMNWCNLHELMQLAWIDATCMNWCNLHELMQLAWIDVTCMNWCNLHELMKLAWIDAICMNWCNLHELM